MKRGEMSSKIPEMFDAFGPQLNTFMSVRILLQYFRRKLLHFSLYIFDRLTKLCSAASFTRAPHYSTVSFTYVE